MNKFLLVSLVLALPATAQEGVKVDERGAVLCSYAMILGALKLEQTCFPKRKTHRDVLSQMIEKHRDFIRRNTDWSQESLDQFELQQTEYISDDACSRDDLTGFAEALSSPAAVQEVEKSLSVDREPVWNPCL